jgi:hypothetical protein
MFSLLLKPEQARKVSAAYVQDMDKADWAAPKGAWIDAKAAFYVVGSKKRGAMGPTIPPSAPAKAPRSSPRQKGARFIPTPKSPPTWPASTAAPSTTRECKPMDPFYSNIPREDAIEIEQLARLMYELRSARDEVLTRLGAAEAEQALACIRNGDLPEHPPTSTTCRPASSPTSPPGARRSGRPHRGEPGTMSMHLDLATRRTLRRTPGAPRGDQARRPHRPLPEWRQPGSPHRRPHAYAIAWAWGEAELRIDTAPCTSSPPSPTTSTPPTAACTHDPLTLPGAAPWDNLQRVITAILADPLLDP